ncbi:glycosyltransferase family 4 protein [Flavobacterium artemisiae]|uniref:Glycosyltransferase family 4 protein n=1 Tax=Flavobacterium artemisiae TaxID=2126556 RepID=A0ABW4H8L6_9FLAO
MKILLVNASDTLGGAARASYRLHKSLLKKNVDVEMLVQLKLSDDFTVRDYSESFFQKKISKIRSLIDGLPVRMYKGRTKTLFSPSWFGFSNVVKKINAAKPDIVHLHWINAGMIKIEDLRRIKAPIVWTLHDNWAFTGGCHIMWECDKYKTNCGSCPLLGSHVENDLSRRVFNRKKKTFEKIPNLTIIGLSRWLENCAKESSLLKKHQVVNLANPIDTNVFKPLAKKTARELWNLPLDKKLVLFGAMSATSDINKGYKELVEALLLLNDNDVEFVIFGSSEPKDKPPFSMKTHYLGQLTDDVSLVSLYSAVDVMVVPSLQETLPQSATESMACGTPVVSFAHTGLLDIIEHKKTGYLAKTLDTRDLASGIEWVLETSDYEKLSLAGREKIVNEFESSFIANKYLQLYESILSKSKTLQ